MTLRLSGKPAAQAAILGRVQKGIDSIASLLPDGHALYVDELVEELRRKQNLIDEWYNAAGDEGRRKFIAKMGELVPIRSRLIPVEERS